MTRRALVRRPGPRLAEGLLTHIARTPVDLELAHRQWEGYVAALRAEGWDTVEVPPADDCPDAVFVEDTVVVHGDLAVISRPGADERKPETAGTEETLARLGYRIARIEEPGTLDGGDVLKHGDTVWVGLGGRTNAAGVDQLAALLEPLGATVVGVPVSRVLHLKSAVTALPDGTVIGHEPLVDDPAVWSSFLPVPEEAGSHVVVLDAGTVLMSTGAPLSRTLFQSRGLRVVAVDIGEFEKLEGCVTCLSVRLRG
ncbi:dimethylargininase [Nocardioides sp. MAHUQ-72]|uniref:dimethylargininase n=1 Tax=unclassified Nocardioides TaxID=2615069 RepID=UPI0036169F2A